MKPLKISAAQVDVAAHRATAERVAASDEEELDALTALSDLGIPTGSHIVLKPRARASAAAPGGGKTGGAASVLASSRDDSGGAASAAAVLPVAIGPLTIAAGDAMGTEVDAVTVANATAALAGMKAAVPVDVPGSKSGARTLALPPRLLWPQLGEKRLFLRGFYQDFYEGPMNRLEPGKAYVINGNGGICKSSFGIYLLWEGVRAGRTVVYVSDKWPHGYIFRADGSVVVSARGSSLHWATSVLCKPDTILIVDGSGGFGDDACGVHLVQFATTVLITSPKAARWKKVVEHHTPDVLFTFPVFSASEIDDMLESCFEELHSPDLRARVARKYERWGGIPRYVLAYAHTDDDDALFLPAFATIDRAARAISCKSFVDDSSISHHLFHLVPAGKVGNEEFVGGTDPANYRLATVELGSREIATRVFEAASQDQCSALTQLLGLSTASPVLGDPAVTGTAA